MVKFIGVLLAWQRTGGNVTINPEVIAYFFELKAIPPRWAQFHFLVRQTIIWPSHPTADLVLSQEEVGGSSRVVAAPLLNGLSAVVALVGATSASATSADMALVTVNEGWLVRCGCPSV